MAPGRRGVGRSASQARGCTQRARPRRGCAARTPLGKAGVPTPKLVRPEAADRRSPARSAPSGRAGGLRTRTTVRLGRTSPGQAGSPRHADHETPSRVRRQRLQATASAPLRHDQHPRATTGPGRGERPATTCLVRGSTRGRDAWRTRPFDPGGRQAAAAIVGPPRPRANALAPHSMPTAAAHDAGDGLDDDTRPRSARSRGRRGDRPPHRGVPRRPRAHRGPADGHRLSARTRRSPCRGAARAPRTPRQATPRPRRGDEAGRRLTRAVQPGGAADQQPRATPVESDTAGE